MMCQIKSTQCCLVPTKLSTQKSLFHFRRQSENTTTSFRLVAARRMLVGIQPADKWIYVAGFF